jgi:endoglucanase
MGVIGADNFTDFEKMPRHDKMYIDVGAVSREKCPIKVGDAAVFDRPFLDLGGRIVAKAMDDRVAVAVLVTALKELESTVNELHFVFTVQEEVGIRGAKTAAYSIEPEIGLAVDVTDTGDTPKGIKMAVELGKGPAIKVLDDGIIVDRRIVDWMAGTAEKYDIPYQYEVLDLGATDAASINLSRSGVPSGCLSIPTRYIHMPSEMVDMDDLHHSVELLTRLISNPISF